MANKEQLYDLRVIELNIKQEKISSKDYENFIKKLPDVSDEAETLIIEEEADEETEEINEEQVAEETEQLTEETEETD